MKQITEHDLKKRRQAIIGLFCDYYPNLEICEDKNKEILVTFVAKNKIEQIYATNQSIVNAAYSIAESQIQNKIETLVKTEK